MSLFRAKPDDAPPPPRPFRPLRTAWHWLNALVAVAILLYLAALAMVRTDGFRGLVQDRLGDVLGLPVRIGGVSSDPAMNLALRDFTVLAGAGETDVVVRVHRLAMDLDWRAVLGRGRPRAVRSDLEGGQGTVIALGGRWEPARLAGLAEWLVRDLDFGIEPARGRREDPAPPPAAAAATPAAPAEAAEPLAFEQCPVTLRGIDLVWMAGRTQELARVDGLDLSITPLEASGRRFMHYRVALRAARTLGGMDVRDLSLEVLETGGQKIVLQMAGDRRPPPRPAAFSRPGTTDAPPAVVIGPAAAAMPPAIEVPPEPDPAFPAIPDSVPEPVPPE
jgi:hypothetical protein